MLADMAINLELARLATYRAASDLDQGIRNSYFASVAKCFAADSAMQAALNAVQVLFFKFCYLSTFIRVLIL